MDQITRVCGERSFACPPFWFTAKQEIKLFRIVGMRWVVGIRLLNEETDLELVGTQLPLGANQCDKRIPTFKHAWNVSLGLLPMGLISDFAELRDGIEQLTQEDYESASYYERWAKALANTLVSRGVVTEDALAEKANAIRERQETEAQS